MYQELVFNVKARKKIYSHIKKNPGEHFRKISRELDIPASTLSYHLKYLIKRELLSKENENGYLRYYLSKKISNNEKRVFNILRETVPRNIILYLLLCLESSQKDMLEFGKRWKKHPSKIGYHLNKHRTTLSFHLKKLLEEDIIESFYDNNNGVEARFRLKNPEEFIDILIKYDKSVLADAYGRYLHWIDDSNGKDAIDIVIDIFYDIFPNPFYS